MLAVSRLEAGSAARRRATAGLRRGLVLSASSALLLAGCRGEAPGTSASGTTTGPAIEGVVVAAAGDIACAPDDPHFDGGAGSTNHCQEAATAALIKRLNPAAVL